MRLMREPNEISEVDGRTGYWEIPEGMEDPDGVLEDPEGMKGSWRGRCSAPVMCGGWSLGLCLSFSSLAALSWTLDRGASPSPAHFLACPSCEVTRSLSLSVGLLQPHSVRSRSVAPRAGSSCKALPWYLRFYLILDCTSTYFVLE